MPPIDTFQEDEILGKAYDSRLMRRLLTYLRPYRRIAVAAVLLVLLFAALDLYIVYLTKIIIDQYIQPDHIAGLYRIAVWYLIVLTLSLFVQYFVLYLTSVMSQRAMFDLRMQIFRTLERYSLRFFNRNPVGRLLTRITSDVESLDNMFSNCVVYVFQDVFSLIGAMALLLWIDWELALVSFSVLPMIVWASIRFKRKVRDSYRKVRICLAKINAFLQECIQGMTTIQVFAQERRMARQFSERNRDYIDAQVDTVFHYSIFFPIVEFLGNLSLALILWYGAKKVFRTAASPDPLTLGTVFLFIQAMSRFFSPVRELADKFNIMQAAMASSERIFKMLDTNDIIPDPASPVRPQTFTGLVEFRNVWFAYQGEDWVLKDVSFTVQPGQTVAVVGATGAGKTTIINLLFRFYDPQKGGIYINGIDIREMDLQFLRRQIGLVLQDVFLFSGDIAGNIRLDRTEITEEQVQAACETVQADPFIRRLPGEYKEPVKERGATLSVGQRQLLSFARALAHDPRLLILDEATSSVDTETESLIQEALETLLTGRTNIVIAHRLSTIRRANRILVLHQGKIVEAGTHIELLERGGVYSRLYQLQFCNENSRA
ncbi:MAG TPA: ABC transporter ATP-binding protein [bacterium]|nr:ABC transporter ATP-binding protein [bacterium]